MAAGEEKRHLLSEAASGSYVGSTQEKGVQGEAPSLELGTRRGRHCHTRGAAGHPNQQQRARRKLYLAASICLVFMVGEAVGGYLAHSLAILTDAAHLLTDFASIMISLFALWVSSRPPTKTMNFGWHRAEILGALLSVLSIWVVTGVLVYLAAQRLLSGDYDIEGSVMLITSACAVAVNIVYVRLALPFLERPHPWWPRGCHRRPARRMGVALHQTGHGHSHGAAAEQPNASVRAAFIHVVGDLLQSVGVLIASYIIFFKPEYKYVDPICTFLFSALVLGTTLSILRDVLLVLMEGRDSTRGSGLWGHPWVLRAPSTQHPRLSPPARNPQRDGLQRRAGRAAGGGGRGGRAQPPHLGADRGTAAALRAHRHQCSRQRAGRAGGGQLPAAGHLPLPHHHHPSGKLLGGDAGLPGVPASPRLNPRSVPRLRLVTRGK
ncbi:proton-coupled zinc antiporter SLC30A2 isoform X2 [Phaenicophaeus curvirostris]|uniref:proton-coupled zinc antiporter SLC30A2 isoform X2 n=1 Tax=Phaenicophaeus curvirostris TaxID=33595 RepID=UPI0037F0E422